MNNDDHRFSDKKEGSQSSYIEIRRNSLGLISFPGSIGNLVVLTGLSRDALMADGNNFLERIPSEDQVLFQKELLLSSEQLSDLSVLVKFNHFRSGERVLKIIASPKREADGSTTWSGLLADETLPVAMEMRISELKQQRDVILQSELIGIMLTQQQKVIWSNSYIKKVLDLNEDEIKEKLINRHFNNRHDFLSIAKRALIDINRGNIFRETVKFLDKNKNVVWFNASGCQIREDSPEIIWILVNITPQKIAENRLIEAVRLAEEANRSKTQLLATVSHEIRTPMSAIYGLSKLALQNSDQQDLKGYLGKIHDATEKLIKTLDHSLELTKLESGKIELESRPFHINDVLEDVSGLFKNATESKGLLFQCGALNEIPKILNGDMYRIRQVLINLIGNAIKFTNSGKIDLSVKCNQIDKYYAYLRFTISDTGIGISEKEIKDLLKPYSQANVSIARIYGGSGLGLVICNQILSLMGSKVEIHSVPNVGSHFSFQLKLPYLDINDNVLPDVIGVGQDSIEGQLDKMPILVAEDNSLIQEMLKEFLELSGAQVDVANNGFEALELLAQNTYAAILMDTQMPLMDGLSTAIQIRKQDDLKNLPIIGLSAGITPDERAACLASGMNEFIAKPFKPNELIATIKRFIQSTNFNPALLQSTILLVDDNLLIQQTLKEFIQIAGAQVDIANDGIQALELLGKKMYSAVLMDTQMPIMDGIETTQRIRQQARLVNLPIIGLSADVSPEKKERCLSAGMNECVSKNIDPASLIEVLAKWIVIRNKRSKLHQNTQSMGEIQFDYSQAFPGFNLQVVSTLKENQVLYKIATLFKEDTQDFLADISQHINDGDLQSVAQKIHYLKSSAAAIGAEDLFTKAELLTEYLISIEADSQGAEALNEDHHLYQSFKNSLTEVRNLISNLSEH
ncbi:response regulator [Polynucleobacter paneuropaeus]|nr:response regulator [Polynucleobacter paneuropaeus]